MSSPWRAVSWKAQIQETSETGEGAEEMTNEGGEGSGRREKESVREKIKKREEGRRGRPVRLLFNRKGGKCRLHLVFVLKTLLYLQCLKPSQEVGRAKTGGRCAWLSPQEKKFKGHKKNLKKMK